MRPPCREHCEGLQQEQYDAKLRSDYFTSVPNSHGENDPKQKKKWENRGVCGAISKGVQPQQQHQTTDENHPSSDDLPHTNMCEHLHVCERAEMFNWIRVKEFLLNR